MSGSPVLGIGATHFMQVTPKLGEFILEDAERDAIHMAVAPVVAGDYLNPGQRVVLVDGDKAFGSNVDPIGVVDPFLKQSVKRGQRFWLLLFPNTITSLRHEWEHPDMPPRPSKKTKRDMSEWWLREFAIRFYVDYDVMMEEVKRAIVDDDDVIMTLGSSQDVDYDQFWHHYQIATEFSLEPEKLTDKWFSCAC